MRQWLMLLLWLPALAMGASAETLKSFLNQTTSAKARFAQMVLDRNMKQLQQATGTMTFSRPGKFRWEYEKPYEQTIVGDGQRLWIYDKDLNQVTVRKLDQALGATPAALLAGSNDALNAFLLKDDGTRDGLEWVEATPRDKESTFERIRMGFGPQGIERMELTDSFGQTTLLRFTGLQSNPKLDAGLFTFTPPKGADVIGDK